MDGTEDELVSEIMPECVVVSICFGICAEGKAWSHDQSTHLHCKANRNQGLFHCLLHQDQQCLKIVITPFSVVFYIL